MRGELPNLKARSYARLSAAEIAWSRIWTTVTHPDLRVIVAFCTIGYLIAINLIIRFPDFGDTVAALAIFP